MKRLSAILLLLATTAVIAAVAQEKPEKPEPPTLSVKRVEEGPGLDSGHKVWETAPQTRVLAKAGHIGNTWVSLKAVHDGEYVYIRAAWDDPTKSLNRSWEWTDEGWAKTEGNEDRLAVIFNNGTPAFDEEGCEAMCHVDMLYTANAGEKLDLWHWKAHRGGMFGSTDDQSIISLQDGGNPKGQKGRKSGRLNDKGKSGYSGNASEDGKAPAWVWKEDTDHDGPFNAETSRETPPEFTPKVGYNVPRERLRDAEGSRGDIEGKGAWKEGRWTIVMRRKLDTGHDDDDAQLKPGEEVSFALAVFDNTGADVGNEHAKSDVAVMHFEE